MSIRTLQVITDDYDGTELKPGQGHTVAFSFEGHHYEIDLSDKNYEAFREVLEAWIARARRSVGTGPHARAGARPAGTEEGGAPGGAADTSAIREWARENGLSVSGRGRISATVRDAYAAAH